MAKPARPTEHEGAREESGPDEPRERKIITPGWAELDKRRHKGDRPVAPNVVKKKPASKRGRG